MKKSLHRWDVESDTQNGWEKKIHTFDKGSENELPAQGASFTWNQDRRY